MRLKSILRIILRLLQICWYYIALTCVKIIFFFLKRKPVLELSQLYVSSNGMLCWNEDNEQYFGLGIFDMFEANIEGDVIIDYELGSLHGVYPYYLEVFGFTPKEGTLN